jgi:hypothetical protein
MTTTWDKSDPRIWFGRWISDDGRWDFRLVVERVPNRTRWDWAVWRTDDLTIVRRGVENSASAAVTAAETMAFILGQGDV